MDNKFILVSQILGISVDMVKSVYNRHLTKINTKEKSQLIHNEKDVDSSWIKEKIDDENYKIIDVGGNGDCFFHVLRHSFRNSYSVKQLREIVSSNITEYIYNTWSVLYKDSLKDLEESNKTLLRTKNEDRKQKIKEDISSTKSIINDYRFMKNVKSLQDLRNVIKTSEYWADEVSINILRDVLDVEFIIFDYSNLNIRKNIDKNKSYYILVNYTGGHYQLVTHKDKFLFEYNTLPKSLKSYLLN